MIRADAFFDALAAFTSEDAAATRPPAESFAVSTAWGSTVGQALVKTFLLRDDEFHAETVSHMGFVCPRYRNPPDTGTAMNGNALRSPRCCSREAEHDARAGLLDRRKRMVSEQSGRLEKESISDR